MEDGICDSLMAKMYIHSETYLHQAQAEIARLQAEVERLTATHVDWDGVRCIVYSDEMWVAASDYSTTRNDALEEAAKSVEYSWGMSVSDAAAAIRALKETP